MLLTPPSGVGLGLRTPHYQEILTHHPAVAWFEVHSENYFSTGGKPRYFLEKIRALYPISLHGVGLSLGATDPLNKTHLNQLKQLIRAVQPCLVSEHLCWTSHQQQYFHDLLPLPFTEEMIVHLSQRIREVQDFLECRILVENISSYTAFSQSTLSEAQFVKEIALASQCAILLDISNIYINSHNFGFDPKVYLQSIPKSLVKEIHLGGFTAFENANQSLLIDTHNQPIAVAVWELYRYALTLFGDIPTLIEWDKDLPALPVLLEEVKKAEVIRQNTSSFCDLTAAPRMLNPAAKPQDGGAWQQQFADTLLKENNADNWSIYRNNIQTNLIQALSDTYPLTLKLIGAPCFKQLAITYLQTHPSRSADLYYYGEHFSSFLTNHPISQSLPYLMEVTKLEWACHYIFLVATPPELDKESLLNISNKDPENLLCVLHPASQLLAFQYPIFRILQLCNQEIDEEINLNEGGCYALIIRRNLDVTIEPLNLAEFTFLHALDEKNSLHLAYQKALAIDTQFPLQPLLIKWTQEKTITQFVLSV